MLRPQVPGSPSHLLFRESEGQTAGALAAPLTCVGGGLSIPAPLLPASQRAWALPPQDQTLPGWAEAPPSTPWRSVYEVGALASHPGQEPKSPEIRRGQASAGEKAVLCKPLSGVAGGQRQGPGEARGGGAQGPPFLQRLEVRPEALTHRRLSPAGLRAGL